MGKEKLDTLVIAAIIILSLWSLTKTLNRMMDKLLEKQQQQIGLLEEIKRKLEN